MIVVGDTVDEDPFDRWMMEMMRLFKKVQEDLMKSLEDWEEFDWGNLEEKFPELETPSGMRIKGPFIQGYYFTIGPDGKPVFKRFGSVPREEKEVRELEEEERIPIRIGPGGIVREPVVDTLDFGDELVVVVEMPGVEEEDIEVEVRDGFMEIRGGSYSKEVSLPPNVDPGGIRKSYRNGILEIRLPKR